jgi:uncharacterized protein YrrD
MSEEQQIHGQSEPVEADEGGATAAEAPVTHQDLSEWRGRTLTDSDGERIGKLEDVYFDIDSDKPQFGTVKEGFFGRHLTFVPLVGATVGPDSLQVAATMAEVKDAPNIALEGDQLTSDDESVLYHHYKLNYTPSHRDTKKRLVRH